VLAKYHLGFLRRLGIRVAPFLTYTFVRNPLTLTILSAVEQYLGNIQGKGSGSTDWNTEGEVNAASAHINRPKAVVFDVGAHRGEWSLQLLKALGPTSKCRIFQFEPSKRSQAALRSLNLSQTTLIEAAVGDNPGTATLYVPEGNFTDLAALYPTTREFDFRNLARVEETVKVVTIDQIVAEFQLDTVDYMKLDVEGHELAVLRGARESLASKRIKALGFEFGTPHLNSRTYFYDLWDFLRAYGYTIKRICPGNILLPIEEYTEELEYYRNVSNYLALLDDFSQK